MSDKPTYRLRNVRRKHDENFVLNIPALDINLGEVFSLLGPTGSGKSTFLRLLAGLDSPTHGSIEFDNRSISASHLPLEIRRRITLVPQNPVLLSGSVRYNVEYGLRVRRTPDRTRRVVRWLDRLGLSKIAEQRSDTLSGGEAQLVALARALVIEPQVLLLDEPTAHLDPAYVALVEDAIRGVLGQEPMIVVWATHNLFQARRTADQSALLLSGQLIEVAPTDAFFEHPTDTRTADFVMGRMVY